MGKYFLDQNSLLYFAVGIVWRCYTLDFSALLVLTILYKLFDNSSHRLKNTIINRFITINSEPDTILNATGDIISSMVGYLIMDYLSEHKFLESKLEEFGLGAITFFWYFSKYGWIQVLMALGIIYYITGMNLFIGFGASFLVDYYGNKYNWLGKVNTPTQVVQSPNQLYSLIP